MFRVYGYLRASTEEQDATRAKAELEKFTEQLGFGVAHWFIENESGAKLHRPELFRLLDIAMPGDVLLVEQIDRLSRLKSEDWEKLKRLINDKNIRIVSLDLPSSFALMRNADELAKAAREQSKWAQRDERLILYKQARMARQGHLPDSGHPHHIGAWGQPTCSTQIT